MLNTDRIQTTHVGSLPRTPELLAANDAYQAGTISWEELVATMQQGVRDIVARQSEIGIDIVNDGEYGHTMSSSVDYGAWWNYSFSRLGGLTPTDEEHLFDRFYRGSAGAASGASGSGIGLAVAAELARAHDGTITAANRPEGGADLTLSLPAAAP